MTCRICRSDQVQTFLHFDKMPLAGAFLEGEGAIASERFFPLTVQVCQECGLIQLAQNFAPEELFHEYFFLTGSVAPLVAHFQAYAGFIARELGAGSVVEFGCNDGTMLAALRDEGVHATGVDPAANIITHAHAKGLDAQLGLFDEAMAEELLSSIGRVDLVTGSNCFAHNPDQRPTMRAARMMLKETGLLAVECMYAGDLLDKMQWDTLYHEHLVVYSLHTISRLMAQEGFTVVDVFRLPMHAGSLRVLASPQISARPGPRVQALLADETARGLNRSETWSAFGRKVDGCLAEVAAVMGELRGSGRVWSYGASGRASMWLNASGMDYVEKVVDSSPARIGRLMPGLHQPIVPPAVFHADPPDVMLVTAWNYFDTIRAKEPGFKGRWVVPLPSLKVC